ncbi:hypothetical protein ACLOJK_034168 [Asimina triloba]
MRLAPMYALNDYDVRVVSCRVIKAGDTLVSKNVGVLLYHDLMLLIQQLRRFLIRKWQAPGELLVGARLTRIVECAASCCTRRLANIRLRLALIIVHGFLF